MPQVKVGYRRLFEAVGCSLIGQDARHFNFPVGSDDFYAGVYVGPEPPFGLSNGGVPRERYAVRGGLPVEIRVGSYQEEMPSGHSQKFFTEIVCWTTEEINAEVAEAFHNDEPAAQNEVFALAEKHIARTQAAVNMTAGAIGLKLHRQLVIKLLQDNLCAFDEQRYALRITGAAIEILDPQAFDEQMIQQVVQPLRLLGSQVDEKWKRSGRILDWLLRAWDEHDPVNKFLCFFIPLEMTLFGYGVDEEEQQKALLQLQAIRDLISNHAEGANKQQLITLFNKIAKRQNPSLKERFKQLAEKANLPSKNADIAAFSRFNEIRNNLVHRGNKEAIQLLMQLSENEMASLEDMAERYVSYDLFKDAQVYQHRFRPTWSQSHAQQSPGEAE